LGALLRAGWVEWAKCEAIELSIDKSGRVFLVDAFAWEASIYLRGWLSEVIVAVHFNVVRLIRSIGRSHAKTDTFIRRPHKCLHALFGWFPPDELSDGRASVGVHDTKVVIVRVILVELFARDEEIVARGVSERIDFFLGYEERLLLALHTDEVDAELVDNGGLLACKGREAD